MMNIFAKAYCRTFQAVFRAALPILPYRNPNIFRSMEEMVNYLKQEGLNDVLLVTDKGLRNMGSTEHLESLMKEKEINCTVYDDTCANPTYQNVEEARQAYLDNGCRALIAFGGGSSMDCAKGVGARLAHPNKSLDQLKGILRVWKKLPPLIAIPTTAGTGSEVTLAAVITNAETKHKCPMNSFPLIPRHAVLDPEVTYSLPKSLTATTGMDALTHAVEAYIGRSTNKETRACALEATELIFKNIETVYNEPSNYEARGNMLHAAYKAGIAFSKSYVGYVHAVAHSLGGQYGTPHGLANSVLLPIVLEDYGEVIYPKLHRLAIAAGIANTEEDDATAAKRFIQAVRDMNKRMNIPETLQGIKEADISTMAQHAAKEGNPLYPVPKLMTAKELEKFYYIVAGDHLE